MFILPYNSITSNWKYLYFSNSGHNSVVSYEVSNYGQLTLIRKNIKVASPLYITFIKYKEKQMTNLIETLKANTLVIIFIIMFLEALNLTGIPAIVIMPAVGVFIKSSGHSFLKFLLLQL